MKNKNVYVAYLNIDGISIQKHKEILKQVNTMISDKLPDDIVIVLPTRNLETKIECINPRFLDNVKEYENILKTVEDLQIKLNELNNN